MASIKGRVLGSLEVVCSAQGCEADVAPSGHAVREGDHLCTPSSNPGWNLAVWSFQGFEATETMFPPEVISVPCPEPWEVFLRRWQQGPEPWLELILPAPAIVYLLIPICVGAATKEGLYALGWREVTRKHAYRDDDFAIFAEHPRDGIKFLAAFAKEFDEGCLTLTSSESGAIMVSLKKPDIVVTLNITAIDDEGCLHINCCRLDGTTMTIKVKPENTVGTIQTELGAIWDVQNVQLKCVAADGRLLCAQDAVSTVHQES